MKKIVWMTAFLIISLSVGVGLEAQQTAEDYEHQFKVLRTEIECLKYLIQRLEKQEPQCCGPACEPAYEYSAIQDFTCGFNYRGWAKHKAKKGFKNIHIFLHL